MFQALNRSKLLIRQCVSAKGSRFVHLESPNVSVTGSGVVVLSLNRQKGKNAFSRDMLEEFKHAVDAIHKDDSVLAVVVCSEVEGVFCAGADLKERLAMPDEQVGTFVKGLRTAFDSPSNITVPCIAAIEGVALGGGLELALACDLHWRWKHFVRVLENASDLCSNRL